MPNTVSLGSFQFTSQKHINTHFSAIRDSQIGALSGTDLAFVCELATYHPKLKGCQIVSAQTGKADDKFGQNAMWVAFTRPGSDKLVWDTISSKPPARSAMAGDAAASTKYMNDNMNDNFRLAVDGQCKLIKASLAVDGALECTSCKVWVVVHECDMDHSGGDAFMFRALVNRFCDRERSINPSFRKEDHFGHATFVLTDPVVVRWQEFHHANSKLQPLCKQCHWSKSGAETSRRKRDRGSSATHDCA